MSARVTKLNSARAQSVSAHVRPFVEDDIERVAELHRSVFGTAASIEEYRKFFADVFLRLPAQSRICSLVAEDAGGMVSGFQGIQARRMRCNGREVVAAILSHYAVDPARRGVTGLRLLRHALEGPQDFSIVDESGDAARRVWEWCGGSTAMLYSMHWIRPLRPAKTVVDLIVRKRSRVAAALATPLASIADRLCTWRGTLHITKPEGSRDSLQPSMLSRIDDFSGDRTLVPDYSDATLQWLLRRAATIKAVGPLRQLLVRTAEGEIAGWFLYYAGSIAEVVQVAACKDSVGLVLDHLIDDASRHGATALRGRLDPMLADELSKRHCIFYRRGHWTLVHSRDSEILNAIDRGDAFLSRLEGEMCMHFQ